MSSTKSGTKLPEVQFLPIDKLKPNPNNPNVLPKDLLEKLKEAIKRFGFVQPILVKKDKNGEYLIVDGNHRYQAAVELGYKTLPAVVTTHDHRFQSISMNKLRGHLDGNVVADIFQQLLNEGWQIPDLSISGFSEDEILAMLAPQTEPEVPGERLIETTEEEEKEYVLELKFDNETDFKFVKKVLRKWGKGKGYSAGILNLCRMVMSDE